MNTPIIRERDTHTPGTTAVLVLELMFFRPIGIIAAAIARRRDMHTDDRPGWGGCPT